MSGGKVGGRSGKSLGGGLGNEYAQNTFNGYLNFSIDKSVN